MKLLLTPVLILYVIVGMFSCSDGGAQSKNPAEASVSAAQP